MCVPPPIVLAHHDPDDFGGFVNACVGNFPSVTDWQFSNLRVLVGKDNDEAVRGHDLRKSFGLLGVPKADLRSFMIKKAEHLFQ
ncbi:MAG: hypothetical protein WAW13_04465 [Minisyncoccia bacterium]